MVKTILYTSNPDFVPSNLDQVKKFAADNGKYYVCLTNEDSPISNLQEGAHVLTTKGNNIYVLKVADGNFECEFAKKCNITGIIKVDYPFSEYEPIINKQNSKKVGSSLRGISARIEEMFMPTEAKDVRIATDGNLCVATNQGYVAINKDGHLTSYPEELTLDLPVFIISKPKEQLRIGDVIALDRSYAKVIKIDGDKITAIGYTGAGKTVHTIKDFLFNQTMVRVVMSLAGNVSGQLNPMLLMAMANKDSKSSLLPLMMMTQNGGAMGMNPLVLMAMFGKDEGFNIKDMLLMSALSGVKNPFNTFFGTPVDKPEDDESKDVAE